MGNLKIYSQTGKLGGNTNMKQFLSCVSMSAVFVLTLSIATWGLACGPAYPAYCSMTAYCTYDGPGGACNPHNQVWNPGYCAGNADYSDNNLCYVATPGSGQTCNAKDCMQGVVCESYTITLTEPYGYEPAPVTP